MKNKEKNKFKLFKDDKKVFLKPLTEEEKYWQNLLKNKKENEILIKPLMVGICRTDVNVAFNINGYEKYKNLTLGHEMVGVLMDGEDNDRLVVINPSLPNNDFVGLNVDGNLTQGFYLIDGKQVFLTPYTTKDIEKYGDELLKMLAYFEPVIAAQAILEPLEKRECNKKLNKNPSKILLIGKNRISELVSVVIKNDTRAVSKNQEIINLSLIELKDLIHKTKQKIIEGEKEIKLDFDIIIETELDQETFDGLQDLVKNKTLFLFKSRANKNLSFNINNMVIKELEFISAKYGDFHSGLFWLITNQNCFKHLLGKVFLLEEWKEAFLESQNKNNQQKIFIKL